MYWIIPLIPGCIGLFAYGVIACLPDLGSKYVPRFLFLSLPDLYSRRYNIIHNEIAKALLSAWSLRRRVDTFIVAILQKVPVH